MDFQSASGAKAWRDIWGSGQGIGAIDKVAAGRRPDRPARRGICGGEGADLRLGRASPASARQSLGQRHRAAAVAADIDMGEMALRARARPLRRRTRRCGK